MGVKNSLIIVLMLVSGFASSAEMDAASYDRVVYSICKDNADVKLCNKLVANLMFQVKINSEVLGLCNQIDEKGGASEKMESCVNARSIDKYIDRKQAASN